MKKIVLELPDDQAMALAQMCKRFCWEDAIRFANRMTAGANGMPSLRGRLSCSVPYVKPALLPR
jgi:hypothetical protein